jgi:hypothetical protein
MDDHLVEVVEELLASTDLENDRERTLPFLYSQVVRRLLNRGFSASGLTMDRLRTVLSETMEERSGCWFLSRAATTVG